MEEKEKHFARLISSPFVILSSKISGVKKPCFRAMNRRPSSRDLHQMCGQIHQSGLVLHFDQLSISTALLFLHHLLDSNEPMDSLAAVQASLFLAGKVRERPRRLRDVMNATWAVCRSGQVLEIDEDFWKMKEKLALLEQVLLRVLDFQIEPILPHHYVLHFIRYLRPNGTRNASEEIPGLYFYSSYLGLVAGVVERLGQVSWNIVNDR